MTTPLVVRLRPEELAKIDSAARKYSMSRSAYVRQVLRKRAQEDLAQKGVGWKEHFERLEKYGRRVSSKEVDELIAISRGRDLG